MRTVIQRVESCRVLVANEEISSTSKGLLILLGITHDDGEEDIDYLITKIPKLRIFSDDDGNMNLSLNDISGTCMVVSQFTLYADTKKGNRPSFIRSAGFEKAKMLYNIFIQKLKKDLGDNKVKEGVFGEHMQLDFINDGPVTIIIDSKNKYI